MLKTSVLRRAIVVHQLNQLERDAGRAQAQTIAHGKCRAAGDAFFVYVGTVSTVIFDHDGAVAPDDRAMRARYAGRSARQHQRARAGRRRTSRSPAAGRRCATRGPGTAHASGRSGAGVASGSAACFAARRRARSAGDRPAPASRAAADRGFVLQSVPSAAAPRGSSLNLAIAQRTEALEQAGQRRDARATARSSIGMPATRAPCTSRSSSA